MTYVPPPQRVPPPATGYGYFGPLAPQNLRAARRAAGALFALGTVCAGCGVFQGVRMWSMTFQEIMAQAGRQMPEMPPGVSPEQMVRAAVTIAVVLILGFATTIMGIAALVRKGGRKSIITGIVLTVLLALWAGLNALAGVVRMVMDPSPGAAGELAFAAGIGVLAVVSLVCLFRALSIPAGPTHQQWQQAQFMAMQQQAAAPPGFGGSPPVYGYGYGAPAQPSPQQALGPIPPPPGEQTADPRGNPSV